MKQLSDDQVRDLIVDRGPEEDDPLVQQPAVYVERALPAGGLLNDHRYQWAHRPRFFRFLGQNPAEARPTRLVECSSGASSASGGPELRRAGFAGLLLGRPQLVAGLRLLDRDRLRFVDQQLERQARGRLLLERSQPTATPQLLQHLLGLSPVAF